MITKRPSNERGRADFGWLDSRHTFSFGSYHDPNHMEFRALRVINDDLIAAGKGFDMHPHRDMEIISYVVEGAIEHRDSLGTGSIIHEGDVQCMTAGTGIRHSEFNPSATKRLRLLQIWLRPNRIGLPPGYQEMSVPDADKRNTLRQVVSPDGKNATMKINQDARIYVAKFDAGHQESRNLARERHAWIQIIDGDLSVNGVRLASGDGAAVSNEPTLTLKAETACHFMLFDLA